MNRLNLVVIAAALTLAAGPVATAETGTAFDLRCDFDIERILKGTEWDAAVNLTGASAEDLHYRIDTAAGRVCTGLCGEVRDLVVGPDGAMMLASNKTETDSKVTSGSAEVLSADRKTLRIQQFATLADGSPVATLQVYRCTETGFTGMPD